MKTNTAILLGAVLCLTQTAYAHHPLTEYRQDTTRTIVGRLLALDLRNPHSVLYVEVEDQQGRTQRWTVEWSAALQLNRQGAADGTLKPDDRVVINGYPSHDPDAHRLWLRTIARPVDGWRWTGGFN